MNLHFETVSDALFRYLGKMMDSPIFNDFRLVGGTALSLQRGHRRSIDIDLFTDIAYGQMPLAEMKEFFEREFPIHRGTESLASSAMGYHIYLGEDELSIVKVDLFYTDAFIFPVIAQDGIRMADQREIAAMKLLALAGPIKRQKDYWDIHEMLEDYPLQDMITWGLQRHPYSLSFCEILDGFNSIDAVEETPEGIDTLKTLDYWELKVMDLKEAIRGVRNIY